MIMSEVWEVTAVDDEGGTLGDFDWEQRPFTGMVHEFQYTIDGITHDFKERVTEVLCISDEDLTATVRVCPVV